MPLQPAVSDASMPTSHAPPANAPEVVSRSRAPPTTVWRSQQTSGDEDLRPTRRRGVQAGTPTWPHRVGTNVAFGQAGQARNKAQIEAGLLPRTAAKGSRLAGVLGRLQRRRRRVSDSARQRVAAAWPIGGSVGVLGGARKKFSSTRQPLLSGATSAAAKDCLQWTPATSTSSSTSRWWRRSATSWKTISACPIRR